jgi:signal peptidase I
MQRWTEKLGPVWPWVKEILFAFGIWLLVTTAVGEARVVPSESMEPTIEIGDRLWTDKLLLRFEPVQRGDIVVFDPPIKSDDPYIKRVIGLPGDKVEVRQGTVFVNGTALKEPYEAEKPAYIFGPVTVPQGKYLMLGDNRNESYDSHYWGFVDASKIKSRAVFRFWPLSRLGRL